MPSSLPRPGRAIRILRRPVLLALSLLVCSIAAQGADPAPDQRPGQRFTIRADQLPKPYATEAVANSFEAIDRPDPPPFQVPEGFSVNPFADGLESARWLAVAPNGDAFLAQAKLGRITVLRDADGDGRAELKSTFASGFRDVHGMAFRGDWLYVSDTTRVWRLPWHAGATQAGGPRQPVTPPGALGDGGGHGTRILLFSRDGSRLFVAVGSEGNIDEDPSPRATVQSFAADGSDQQTYASGLRNPVGLALYPGTDDVYAVVNERDGLGDGLVPDYLTRLAPGGFYGWPYAYIGQHAQPDFPQRQDLVAKAIVPDLLFESHSAPLGLVFYEGQQFPADYRGSAFVALHGSWNSSKPTGYKVVRVPFANGRPAGYYENFLTGFWSAGTATAEVWGRPAGLAVAADGSLLVADDIGGIVWRVSYRK
jgi:glucose/arabinose dehydrogenase